MAGLSLSIVFQLGVVLTILEYSRLPKCNLAGPCDLVIGILSQQISRSLHLSSQGI